MTDQIWTPASMMQRYALSNPEGGDLMAPPAVLELVPESLRSVHARTETE